MTTPAENPEEKKLNALQAAILNRKLVEAEITLRAWTDEAFRKKLESNPTEAFAEAGIQLLDSKTIRVIPEEPGTIRITLPPKPTTTAEINDGELESMAGGGFIDTGRCQLYKDAQKKGDYEAGVAIAFGVLVGVSWGHA